MSVIKLKELARRVTPEGFSLEKEDEYRFLSEFDARRELWEQEFDAGTMLAKEEIFELTLTKVEMQRHIAELTEQCEFIRAENAQIQGENEALAAQNMELSLLIYGNK